MTRGGKRSGIHISDLIHCKRAVTFNRLDDNPPPPTERTLKFFIGGGMYHTYLQNLLEEGFEVEKEVIWECSNGLKVIGHVDAYKDGTVIEIKTSESTKVARVPNSYNVRQLKMYMAILNASQGSILYLILGSTYEVKEYFVEYHFTIDEKERQIILEEIEKSATEIQAGITNKEPGLVSHIADDPTYMYRDKNWMCNNCFYKSKCDIIRHEGGELIGETSDELLTELREHFRSKTTIT